MISIVATWFHNLVPSCFVYAAQEMLDASVVVTVLVPLRGTSCCSSVRGGNDARDTSDARVSVSRCSLSIQPFFNTRTYRASAYTAIYSDDFIDTHIDICG